MYIESLSQNVSSSKQFETYFSVSTVCAFIQKCTSLELKLQKASLKAIGLTNNYIRPAQPLFLCLFCFFTDCDISSHRGWSLLRSWLGQLIRRHRFPSVDGGYLKAEESCDSLFFFGVAEGNWLMDDDRTFEWAPSCRSMAGAFTSPIAIPSHGAGSMRWCLEVALFHQIQYLPKDGNSVKAHKSRDVSLYLTHLWHNSSIESLNPAIKVDGTNPKNWGHILDILDSLHLCQGILRAGGYPSRTYRGWRDGSLPSNSWCDDSWQTCWSFFFVPLFVGEELLARSWKISSWTLKFDVPVP